MTGETTTSTEPGGRSERVLVVDDDRGVGDCIEMLLKRAGYDCVVARLGNEGLAELSTRRSSGWRMMAGE